MQSILRVNSGSQKKITLLITGLLIGGFSFQSTLAQLKVQVGKSTDDASIPISVIGFKGFNSNQFSTTIMKDLNRSGLFNVQLDSNDNASKTSELNLEKWKSTGLNYIVTGLLSGNSLSFELGNVVNQNVLEAGTFNTTSTTQLQRVAHKISDVIFKKLTGITGSFDTKMVYVLNSGRHYSLVVADSDGQNPKSILNSNEPIFSPSWSPDGSKIAYSSLEGKQSKLMIQELYSGKRRVLSQENGLNSAPSWSPDGQSLAISLSKDGNPEIYTISASGGNLTRLTNHQGIDTEPFWAKDGYIYFTSDRSGSPQIYRVSQNGGDAQKVTNNGNYNACGVLSSDARYLVTMNRQDSGFGIAITDLKTNTSKRLTNGGRDECPSISGNGKIIVFSSGQKIESISSNGKVRQILSNTKIKVRDISLSSK